MANNLKQLEEQLNQLQARKAVLITELKSDVEQLQEAIKPVNLIKNGISDLLSSKTSQNFLMSTAAGIVSSMLLGGKGGMIKSLIGQLAGSDMAKDFIEKEKPRITEWIQKLKDVFTKKDNPEDLN